ncbi:IAA acetyltransferase [Rhodovulum sp. P5]|uniref:GNAT family N-acetyltransferase n=1 Tax=Rhodovulum sp. P5 TaxID=1564506 RepID=UPI0009C3E074|nr:GNAT family N-acetyltransferase [Rhodovulum sp. P5]ARE41001.1 IAA acetyltransferase [Rhodovulum sp. P5]
MTVIIHTESPLSGDARDLIAASEAALRAVYPPEECFTLSPEELARSGTQFLVARSDGRPVGCVALVDQIFYGEVKRLFVDTTARGVGVGRALMEEAESAARAIGLGALRLETGRALLEAVSLYRAMEYVERGPFADYPDIASNMFMEKQIGMTLFFPARDRMPCTA